MTNLNYAERAVLLERIEALETDLLIERALNANLQAGIDALMAGVDRIHANMFGGMTDAEAGRLHLDRTADGLHTREA